jgi:hypothetical protein
MPWIDDEIYFNRQPYGAPIGQARSSVNLAKGLALQTLYGAGALAVTTGKELIKDAFADTKKYFRKEVVRTPAQLVNKGVVSPVKKKLGIYAYKPNYKGYNRNYTKGRRYYTRKYNKPKYNKSKYNKYWKRGKRRYGSKSNYNVDWIKKPWWKKYNKGTKRFAINKYLERYEYV